MKTATRVMYEIPQISISSGMFHRNSLYPTLELRASRVRAIERIRLRFETAVRKAMYRFLIKQMNLVLIDMGLDTGVTRSTYTYQLQTRALQDNYVSGLFNREEQDAKLLETFNPFVREIILVFGKQAIDELKQAGFNFDIEAPPIQNYVANTLAERSRLINKTTAKKIQVIVNAGVDEGLPINEIGAQIKERFPKISRFRANTISRTEVGRAQGIATYEGYVQGEAEAREWLTARDSRVRGSDPKDEYEYWHTSMDGQVRDIDEPFVGNGGQTSLYVPPSDSGHPGWEINCRCTTASLKL